MTDLDWLAVGTILLGLFLLVVYPAIVRALLSVTHETDHKENHR